MILRELVKPSRLVLLRLVPAAAAGAVLAITAATAQLHPIASNVSIGLIVISIVLALVPKRADVRTHAGAVFATVAVAVAGSTRTGMPYKVACAIFAAIVLSTLRAPLLAARIHHGAEGATAEARTKAAAIPAPRWAAVAVLAVCALIVTSTLVTALPPASLYAERQIQRMAGNSPHENDQVGFATAIRVGSLRRMLKSDRVVMRIDGEPIEYLRGAVLDYYESQTWSSSLLPAYKWRERGPTKAQEVIVDAKAPIERTTTRIELSRAALSARTPDPRWFLPADACDVRTPSGRIGIDPHGATRPEPPNNARDISFHLSGTSACGTSLPKPAPPGDVDTDMPPKLRPSITRLATEWTAGANTDRERVEALVRRLSHYEYSLEDRRAGPVDPVVDFLERHHRGHCELFASALALLARSIGIPTRLVVGYRVDEVNSITGLAVVRDRNAHTWTDAWVDGRWQSFDATPPSELHASTRPSKMDHLGEALRLVWDRTLGFLARITLLQYGIFAATSAVVLSIIRRFMQRRRVKTGGTVALTSRPLPAFETLATALERAGWGRVPSEPLERFAQRVTGAGEPWSSEVADVLERYAQLRYGGIGEERTIARRLDDLARKIRPTS